MLTSVISELSNASLTAQEMSAIYAQCLYYKRQGGEALAAYEKYLHQSDYYRKYCISGFDEIVHYSQDDIDGTALLTVIAVMALNIDLTLVEIDWKDSLQVIDPQGRRNYQREASAGGQHDLLGENL